MTKNVDCTDLLERLEAFEERLEVSFESLFCEFESKFKAINVKGEIHSLNGPELNEDLELVVAIYDQDNRVIATKGNYILKDNFFGFEVFDKSLNINKKLSEISKIRIYPKKGN